MVSRKMNSRKMIDTQTLVKALSSLFNTQTPKQLKVKFNTFLNVQDLFTPANTNILLLLNSAGKNATDLLFGDSTSLLSVVGTSDEVRTLGDEGTFSSLTGAACNVVDGAVDEDCSCKFRCE